MASVTLSSFLALPPELIDEVLTYLTLRDLLSVGQVNQTLYHHSKKDIFYQPLVQRNIPGATFKKSANLTWRELYITHHPYWFIPRNKLWFSDATHTGKLLIARYDHRLNAIEAYALVAERPRPVLLSWDWNPGAIVYSFAPCIKLDLNAPVVRLEADVYGKAVGNVGHRLQKEIPMNVHEGSPASAGLFSRFMLTRPWPSSITGSSTPVWPPLILPSKVRTRIDSPSHFRDTHHRPSTSSELSETTFRLRKWMEFSSRPLGVSTRVGEDITTWATIPEECYTPTKEKPWQGIWCGDYAGHGCEFLVIMQPDDPKPLPERAQRAMRMRERANSIGSDNSWMTAPEDDLQSSVPDELDSDHTLQMSEAFGANPNTPHGVDRGESFHDPDCVAEDEKIYRGRIEAVKLTGDPNIPRGEYTFIAPDIGPDGFIRVATEDMFKGARIVKSVGHVADRGFVDDDFMTSQLILISHDKLAQYWETYGHVSFYQRVNLDEFINV